MHPVQALQVEDTALVASTLAVDNLAMALYFAAMAVVPVPRPSASPTNTPIADPLPPDVSEASHRTSDQPPDSNTHVASTGSQPPHDQISGTQSTVGEQGNLDKNGDGNPEEGATQGEGSGAGVWVGVWGRVAAGCVTLCAAAACCAAGKAAAAATVGSGFGLAFMAVFAVGVSAVHGLVLRRGYLERQSWLGDGLFGGALPSLDSLALPTSCGYALQAQRACMQ